MQFATPELMFIAQILPVCQLTAKSAGPEVARLNARLPEVEGELAAAYGRGEELEALAEALKN